MLSTFFIKLYFANTVDSNISCVGFLNRVVCCTLDFVCLRKRVHYLKTKKLTLCNWNKQCTSMITVKLCLLAHTECHTPWTNSKSDTNVPLTSMQSLSYIVLTYHIHCFWFLGRQIVLLAIGGINMTRESSMY